MLVSVDAPLVTLTSFVEGVELEGFGPPSRAPEAKLEAFDWLEFKNWLIKRFDRGYALVVLRYSKNYSLVFDDPGNASAIAGLPRDKRRCVMNALANLARYRGQYDVWWAIVRGAGLKYEKRQAIDVALGILRSDLGSVEDRLLEGVKVLPRKHGVVLAFTAVTGLRPDEGCKSAKLVSELAGKGRLSDYFNESLMMLEHFKYRKLFFRGCENAYVSFVPHAMLNCPG